MTPYGVSKLGSERVIHETAGLRWMIIRPGVVYGPTDRAVFPLFQAAARAMIAFGNIHHDISGQVFVIFILTVAAAEAALALGLVVLLYRRRETLDSEAWSELRETA